MKKIYISVTYVVRGVEGIVVIVRADVLPELIKVKDFLPKLMGAVTEWVRTTNEGRDLWQDTNENIIIGDLCTFNDERLNELLADVGILNFSAYSTLGEDDWTYEDNLVNEPEDER